MTAIVDGHAFDGAVSRPRSAGRCRRTTVAQDDLDDGVVALGQRIRARARLAVSVDDDRVGDAVDSLGACIVNGPVPGMSKSITSGELDESVVSGLTCSIAQSREPVLPSLVGWSR